MSYQPTRKERLEELKPYVGPTIATLIVLGVITWVTWRQLTPAPRRFVATSGGDTLAAARTSDALTRSQAAESEAQEALARGDRAEALEKLRAALRWQQQANAAQAAAAKDLPREVRLATTLAEIEAEPLQTAVDLGRTLGRAAVAREQWDEALKAFTDARRAQAEINQRFPGSRHADAAAIGQLDAELDAANANRLALESTRREREGEQAQAGGAAGRAGAAFEAAAALQREINEKFPRSRFVTASRAAELLMRRDTALAADDLARAAALDGEAAQFLRARQTDLAGERLAAAAALLEGVATAHPRARNLDGALREKASYLASLRGELAAVQERVIGRLVRLPAGAAQMLGTEVSQELFLAVMRTSPSRQAGRALPVDSVSWLDAQDFCRRLGWILAARVRLPNEAEFRAGFGRATTDGAAELAAGAWSSANADGRTHDVGTSPRGLAGCWDLAGNVAEWLDAPASADTAPVAGGSYLDAPDALRRVPVVAADKRERARHIGFRVMVEWGN